MSKTQITIIALAAALVGAPAMALTALLGPEASSLAGPVLLGLAVLGASLLASGAVGFGLLLRRRVQDRAQRHARRLVSLCDVHSYS